MTEIATCGNCGERFPTYDAERAPVCGACQPRDEGVDWAAALTFDRSTLRELAVTSADLARRRELERIARDDAERLRLAAVGEAGPLRDGTQRWDEDPWEELNP